MSNRLSEEKAKAIAAEYCTNGYEKVKALLACGYKQKYAERGGLKLFDNVGVKAEIARIQTKVAEKCEVDAEWLANQYKENVILAAHLGHISASNQALDSLAKHTGFFEKDNKQRGEATHKLLELLE